MGLLEVKDIDVFYGKACSLKEVSVACREGEVVGIIGPNGAGKSTLLDSVIGLTAWQGQILFDGRNLAHLTPTKIIRLGIGYAPERRNLFSMMNVKENLMVGAYRSGKREIERNLKMVFDLFPILEKRQKQEARTQSGGEQQMLSLARALMSTPKLFLVDEPTLGLAPLVCSEISRALKELNEIKGIAIVIAEQNVNFALVLSQKIYLLETGKIKMEGVPEELKEERYIQETYFGVEGQVH